MCNKDCLACGHSMSIPNDETHSEFDELFCVLHQKEVIENDCCKDFNGLN